jgi:predicted component of type VI protein secretion system
MVCTVQADKNASETAGTRREQLKSVMNEHLESVFNTVAIKQIVGFSLACQST